MLVADGTWGLAVNRFLLELTNAYLAIEGLLKSRVLSAETREKLELAMRVLDEESAREMKKHAENEHLHHKNAAS